MIYLDTHVIVWLYSGLVEKLSDKTIQLIENNDLCISPILQLELTYLFEIKKITRSADVIIHELQSRIGLIISDLSFNQVMQKAETLRWTRDPFDRLITAHALCDHAKLLTKDKIIRKHYKQAIWD